jgi:membrane protein required for colicin V production
MHFNYLDIVIALPFLWAIYRGWVKGFILQLCSLIAIVLGIWGAQVLTDILVPYLKTHYGVVSPYTRITVFALVLVVTFALVYLVGFLLSKWIKVTAFSIPNRLSGVIFCLAKYWIIVGFIVFYIDKTNNTFNYMDPTLPDNSFFYNPLLQSARWIYELFIS